MDVKLVSLIVAILVFVNFVNAAIVIQAPKYVPKNTLQRMVWKYVKEAKNLRTQTNKDIEFEIPIKPPRGKKQRNPHRGNPHMKIDPGIFELNDQQAPKTKLRPTIQAQIDNHISIQSVNDWFSQFRRTPSLKEYSSTPSPFVLPPDSYFIDNHHGQSLVPHSKQSFHSYTQFPSKHALNDRHQFYKMDYKPAISNHVNPMSSQGQVKNKIQSYQKPQVPKIHSLNHNQMKGDVLSHARKMVQEEEQRLKEFETNREMTAPAKRRIHKLSNSDIVYKEDLDEALEELAERLIDKRKGNKRLVYKEDLTRALDQFEQKYRSHQDYLATTTVDPCGKERILEEGLKPALKKDLWDYLEDSGIKFSLDADVDNELNSVIKNRRSGGFADKNKIKFENDILDLVNKGAVIGNDPVTLQKQGLIPVRIEVPKSYKELLIKTG